MNIKTLDQMRLVGDEKADGFVKTVFADADEKVKLRNWLTDKDLSYSPDHAIFSHSKQLPEWADRKLMKAGSDFFALHSEAIMALLGLLSLPYCYTAADGAMVIYLSERIRTDTAKRLSDTAGFVWDVLSPDAFAVDGKGFISVLKVRLTHATARYYSLQSGKWNMQLGYPINQEDMAGTNLSFSLIVIRGLRKLGFSITYQEQQAYIHLWNVIGFLLGLDNEMLPFNGKEAYQLETAIRERQFRASEHGTKLTKSLVAHLFKLNQSSQFNNTDLLKLMRYLLGNSVADMLGIAKGNLTKSQVSLLTIKNAFNDLLPADKPAEAYKKGHRKFRQLQLQSEIVGVV